MSGGQKQRVMIAIALAAEPDIVIADEPTTALDVTIQAQILDLLQELQASQKMAMLLITHDLAIVAKMAHRVALMYAGQVVEVADAKEFFARPLHPYAVNLFEALPDTGKRGRKLASIARVGAAAESGVRRVPVRGSVRRRDGPVPDDAAAAASNSGRATRSAASCTTASMLPSPSNRIFGKDPVLPPDPPAGDVVLEVKDYQVWFPIRKGLLKRTVGYVKAVDGVSFSLRAGRTLALVGESGSGKTTVGKAVAATPSQRRDIRVRRCSKGSRWRTLDGEALRTARRAAQIVFQDPFASLNPRMRVNEILEEGVASLRPDVTRGRSDGARRRAAGKGRLAARRA